MTKVKIPHFWTYVTRNQEFSKRLPYSHFDRTQKLNILLHVCEDYSRLH